jgi:L-amino acid N-acyltransferase YncA
MKRTTTPTLTVPTTHDGSVMTLAIARATDGDWPRIWPVWHEVVAPGDTYTFPTDSTSEDGRRLWMPASPAQTWIATDAEAPDLVLGTYLLKPNQTGPGSHVANAGFMVGSAARGRGLGRALAEHCITQARLAGYLGMQFNAVVANNHRAIALWHSLGFETVGTVPRAFRHPRDGLVDLLVMYQDL